MRVVPSFLRKSGCRMSMPVSTMPTTTPVPSKPVCSRYFCARVQLFRSEEAAGDAVIGAVGLLEVGVRAAWERREARLQEPLDARRAVVLAEVRVQDVDARVDDADDDARAVEAGLLPVFLRAGPALQIGGGGRRRRDRRSRPSRSRRARCLGTARGPSARAT